MLAAATRATRGAAFPWEGADGTWSTFAEASKAARNWSDQSTGGGQGHWFTEYSNKKRNILSLRCIAHKDCPFLQKVAWNQASGCFARYTAFAHAAEANDRRRSNSALTFAQRATLLEGLDMGGKPMEVLNAITKKRKAELIAQGKNPLQYKKAKGGLKGTTHIIHV